MSLLTDFLLPILGLLLLGVLIAEPFLIVLLVAACYERKLKKMMPPTTEKGQKLFEHAMTVGDEKVKTMVRRGALFQCLYAFLWGVTLLTFSGIFIWQNKVVGLFLLPCSFLFFYWSMPFFYLWRKRI